MPTLRLKDPRFWTAMVAFSLGAWLLVPQMIGERPPVVRAEDIPDATYICRESKETFLLPASDNVLPNPKTGKLTLVPAIFDPKKKAWKQEPPLDVTARMRQRHPPAR